MGWKLNDFEKLHRGAKKIQGLRENSSNTADIERLGAVGAPTFVFFSFTYERATILALAKAGVPSETIFGP